MAEPQTQQQAHAASMGMGGEGGGTTAAAGGAGDGTANDSATVGVDAKAYYGYLFQVDKKPTKVLDALLRGLAGYISEHVGDTEQKFLTPDKMAAFYKAVGGNYDSLFVALPPPSISWIYASIGCQHSLLPHPTSDFVPPCIPALTTRGFVRWQSIEILLGPDEHVPFIQAALANFHIRNPDTGEPFPVDLPASAFPATADPDIERWHEQCAKSLRKSATPNEDIGGGRPEMPARPKVSAGFSHVHARPRPEYFDRAPNSSRGARPAMSYQHVSSASTAQAARPGMNRSPSHQSRQYLAPEDTRGGSDPRGRRRSFPSPGREADGPGAGSGSYEGNSARRHSHSHGGGERRKRRGSMSSDASSEDDQSDLSPGHMPSQKTRPQQRSRPVSGDYTHSNSHGGAYERERERERGRTDGAPSRPPSSTLRYAVPPSTQSRQPRSSRDRADEEHKRRTYPLPTPIDHLASKLAAPFLSSKKDSYRRDRDRDRERDRDRHRDGDITPRSDSHGHGNGNGTNNPNNGHLRWRDLDATAKELWRKENEEERAGSGREHEREKRRDRDVPGAAGAGSGAGTGSDRRGSYEGDFDNLPGSSGSGRSFRDRERERRYVSSGGGGGGGGSGRESSGRESAEGRTAAAAAAAERSPIRGVDGRRYPGGL